MSPQNVSLAGSTPASKIETPAPSPKASSQPAGQRITINRTLQKHSSRPVAFLDITNQFHAATSVLDTGQLIKDDFFTLFESVGALEIMDSKMDSGYLEPGETLEDEYDLLRALLPEEITGIMDQILCLEAAWHMGHPLSQTLFTCLYIERLVWPTPRFLEHAQFSRAESGSSGDALLSKVLRAYCISTIKACHFVHGMITSQNYFEEEDFTSQLFHRELLPEASVTEICSLLDEGLAYIAASDIRQETKAAIETRLKFRQSLLTSLKHDTRLLDPRDISPQSCITLLREIKESSSLGTPVQAAFSTKIQRTLASSVPPRPIVSIALSDAIAHFERLCNDEADADELLLTESGEDLLTGISVLMSRNPQPSVYIRSFVQSFLQERQTSLVLGKLSGDEFLLSNISALVLPASPILDPSNATIEAPTNPRFQIARLIAEFSEKMGPRYLHIFRTACLNKCRIRRTLCHSVVDWDSLQADAEDIDSALQQYTGEQALPQASDQLTYAYPLSSWVYHHKLNQIRQIIQLGFELSVYAPDEIAGMYSSLSHICTTHLGHVERITFFLQQEMESRNLGSLTASDKTTGDPIPRQAFQRTMKHLFRSYNHLKATDSLARALRAVYTLLQRHGIIKAPGRPYSTNPLRYELRMRPFLSLSIPEPENWPTFENDTYLQTTSDQEILDDATSLLAAARHMWDEILKAGWSVEADPFGDEPDPKPATPAPSHSRKGAKVRSSPHQAPPASIKSTSPTIATEWNKSTKNIIRSCIATGIAIAVLKKHVATIATRAAPAQAQAQAQEQSTTAQNTSARAQARKGDVQWSEVSISLPKPGSKECWHDWWVVPKIQVGGVNG